MKAVVLYGQEDIRIEEVDRPKIGDDEVLVRVRATGVCGSDMPRVLGTGAHYYPIILGHEFSGQVAEIGSKVSNVAVGDKVSGAPLMPCHKCIDCSKGHYSQCKNYSFIGSRTSGSWAEYVKMPAINAVKLPDELGFVEGAFLEPITVALHGLFVMDFKGGTDLAIVGMGTIGLLTLQCAKALGAKNIYAFDIDDEKLDIAKEYGAHACINTGKQGFKDEIWKATNDRGFEQVIETAGVEFTEKLSLEIASNKGNVMFIGTPSKPISLEPREFEYINRKELTVRGSWMSYSAPFPGKEWELAAYYLNREQIKVDRLIDRKIGMESIASAFNDLKVPGKVKGKILMEV
ncbi:MAG: galactitol-1-phosphate 5-dehydrogenase [Clostridiales bacterium]|nr:galactitol-1-phosphate 5-dehydrogenase [Clostridiales bacterium]